MKNPSLIAIIGLGNPDEKFTDSPHNAGFAVLDLLVKNQQVKFSKTKTALVARVKDASRELLLVKPMTYMNKSGEAVKSIAAQHEIKTENIWLIHDDIDLPLGMIRIVKGRGAGGHKGVLSILKVLKSKNVIRFRVGIRPKALDDRRSPEMMNKFVTKPLAGGQKKRLEEALLLCSKAVSAALEGGIEGAMNEYN